MSRTPFDSLSDVVATLTAESVVLAMIIDRSTSALLGQGRGAPALTRCLGRDEARLGNLFPLNASLMPCRGHAAGGFDETHKPSSELDNPVPLPLFDGFSGDELVADADGSGPGEAEISRRLLRHATCGNQ